MPAGDITTKAKRRTVLKRYRSAAGFVRLCVLPHPDFTIQRSRLPESRHRYIPSKWSKQSGLSSVVALSASHQSLSSRTHGRPSPPIEASGSRQFLSPHYALGRHELERRSGSRYDGLGIGADPGQHHPDLLPVNRDSEPASNGARVRTLSEPTKLTDSPAKAVGKPRSVSQPLPPFVARLSSEGLNGTAAAKLLTPIMEDAPTLHANALFYPSLSSSLDAMHEVPADRPPQTNTHHGDEDAVNDDLATALPSVILTAATPFASGVEHSVPVFTPPTTPEKRRVSTTSTETYNTQNRLSDATVYVDCESIHSTHDILRDDLPSKDGMRGRRRSTSPSERHRYSSSLGRGDVSRRPSGAASYRTRRSLSREASEHGARSPHRTPSARQPVTRRSSYESALSFSDSVALTLAYLNTHGDTQDVTSAARVTRRASRELGLRIATNISPRFSGPATEFSPTETAVGTPNVKGKGSERRASWADRLANKLTYLVRSPTRTNSLRLGSRISRSSAHTEAPIPIPPSA